jgi:hypothetical protein
MFSCIPGSFKRPPVTEGHDAHHNYETYCWHLDEPADVEPPIVLEPYNWFDHGCLRILYSGKKWEG